jgi:hypothetical protein
MWIPTVAMASGAPGGEASVFLTGSQVFTKAAKKRGKTYS